MAAMILSSSNARDSHSTRTRRICQIEMEFRARTLRKAVGSAFCQQLAIFALAATILDGGLIAEVCVFAMLAFWIGVAIIYFRRRGAFTKADLIFVEAATVPLAVLAAFLCLAVWRARGVM